MSAEKQLTFATLGGEIVTVQMRGKHYVQPKGYAAPPGTGPAGETCGSCRHRTGKGTGQKTFPGCALTRACWTSGRGTDILVRAPACRKWEAKDGAASV